MFAMGHEVSAVWFNVVGMALLGCIISPAAEVLIARGIPRLGGIPPLSTRIMTAALTGIVCAAFAFRFGISLALPAFLFFAILGAQLARIDVALHLLPNPLVLMLLIGGLVLLLPPGIIDQQANDLLRAVLGAFILFAGYLALGLMSPGGIGMGDVKLAAPVGLYLGYLGWSQLLYGGLLGFILNGLVTVLILKRNDRKYTTEVAHGPSMLGAVLAVSIFVP